MMIAIGLILIVAIVLCAWKKSIADKELISAITKTNSKLSVPQKRFTIKADGLNWKIEDSFTLKYPYCWTIECSNYDTAIANILEYEENHRLAQSVNKQLQSSIYKIIFTQHGFIIVKFSSNYTISWAYDIPEVYQDISEAIKYIEKAEQNHRLAEITNNSDGL